jgi:hypothetical protein
MMSIWHFGDWATNLDRYFYNPNTHDVVPKKSYLKERVDKLERYKKYLQDLILEVDDEIADCSKKIKEK